MNGWGLNQDYSINRGNEIDDTDTQGELTEFRDGGKMTLSEKTYLSVICLQQIVHLPWIVHVGCV